MTFILSMLANWFVQNNVDKTEICYKCYILCSFSGSFNFYKLVEGFTVTCLFTGQKNTKGYDTITDVLQLLVGSAY